MKELRQIKLALIDNDFMTGRVRSILSNLDELLGDLSQYKNDNYSDYIFYGKKEKDIRIAHNINKKIVYIDERYVWEVFKVKIKLNNNDLKPMIIWYIERVYNINPIYVRCIGGINELDGYYKI